MQLLAQHYFPELERLKVSLDIKGKSTDHFFDLPQHARHTADTTQLATSNLPQLDWDQLSTPSAPQLPADVPSAPQAGQQNDPFAYAAPALPPPPPPPASDDPFAASPGLGNTFQNSSPASLGNGGMDLLTGAFASNYSQAPQQQSAPTAVSRSSSIRRPVASQAALNRHAIMPQQQTRQQPTSRPSQQSLYPQFDKEPLAPIDYGIADPSAPALPDQLASLQLQQPNLMDAPARNLPSPQLELQLGPQQLQVLSVAAFV